MKHQVSLRTILMPSRGQRSSVSEGWTLRMSRLYPETWALVPLMQLFQTRNRKRENGASGEKKRTFKGIKSFVLEGGNQC